LNNANANAVFEKWQRWFLHHSKALGKAISTI